MPSEEETCNLMGMIWKGERRDKGGGEKGQVPLVGEYIEDRGTGG